MCLSVIAYRAHSKYRLIIVSNRDEYYQRPSRPAHFWEEAPNILAGKDLQDLGTWFGITRTGKLGLITNVRDPGSTKNHPPSRGSLVKRFLMQDLSPEDYLQELDSRGNEFNGFNLVFGYLGKLYYYTNQRGKWEEITPGVHALSNANLNTPWPKVQFAQNAVQKLLAKKDSIQESSLFKILFNDKPYPLETLPNTGIGNELEKLLSPVFICSPEYGTRSSSVLFVD